MFTVFWSAKGGAGTTVVTAATAALATEPVLVVDLGGDLCAALGVSDRSGPGIAEWLVAGDEVPVDGLVRLEQRVTERVSILGRGKGPLVAHRVEVLAGLLAADPRPVLVDAGPLDDEVSTALAAAATRSVLVTRLCYLSLRRAARLPIRPSEVVVVQESGRSLGPAEVSAALGVGVSTVVRAHPKVARAVDAGLLTSRVPRGLARSLARRETAA